MVFIQIFFELPFLIFQASIIFFVNSRKSSHIHRLANHPRPHYLNFFFQFISKCFHLNCFEQNEFFVFDIINLMEFFCTILYIFSISIKAASSMFDVIFCFHIQTKMSFSLLNNEYFNESHGALHWKGSAAYALDQQIFVLCDYSAPNKTVLVIE